MGQTYNKLSYSRDKGAIWLVFGNRYKRHLILFRITQMPPNYIDWYWKNWRKPALNPWLLVRHATALDIRPPEWTNLLSNFLNKRKKNILTFSPKNSGSKRNIFFLFYSSHVTQNGSALFPLSDICCSGFSHSLTFTHTLFLSLFLNLSLTHTLFLSLSIHSHTLNTTLAFFTASWYDAKATHTEFMK